MNIVGKVYEGREWKNGGDEYLLSIEHRTVAGQIQQPDDEFYICISQG